jgi:hypothetical protein
MAISNMEIQNMEIENRSGSGIMEQLIHRIERMENGNGIWK